VFTPFFQNSKLTWNLNSFGGLPFVPFSVSPSEAGCVKINSFVKSPSAALRFTPEFLRAWHLELFTKPSLPGVFTRSSKFEGEGKSPVESYDHEK
jgi:hypothetical protein